MVAAVEENRAILKGFDAVFGALGVQHNGDGQIQVGTHLFHQVDAVLVILIGAVGEIQTRHVHTGLAQADHHLFRVGGRADGADNFGFSHSHIPPVS